MTKPLGVVLQLVGGLLIVSGLMSSSPTMFGPGTFSGPISSAAGVILGVVLVAVGRRPVVRR